MESSNGINRREFIRNTAVGAAAIGLSAPAFNSIAGENKKKVQNKVGLYSITFLGAWYQGEALILEDIAPMAKKLGFDGIEIDGKRPHGNPLDMPTARCKDLKKRAEDIGQEIYAVSANNDFSSPVPEYRECQIVYMRDLIRMTSDLGVKPLRVFLGWPGITKHPQLARYDIAKENWQHAHYQFEPEQIWEWCREGMIECAKFAEDYGVTLALQNHKPVINDWRDVMRMVKEVDSPALKVCLDAPIMEDKSIKNMREAAKAVGDLQVLSHFGGEWNRDKDGILVDLHEKDADGNIIKNEFYPRFIKTMNEIGYKGWYSYELCHPLPIKNDQTVGIDFAEDCAKFACEMMKGLVTNV